jgi:hypothetical protein
MTGDLPIVTEGENFELRFGEAKSLLGELLKPRLFEVVTFRKELFCFSYSPRAVLVKGLFCRRNTNRKR